MYIYIVYISINKIIINNNFLTYYCIDLHLMHSHSLVIYSLYQFHKKKIKNKFTLTIKGIKNKYEKATNNTKDSKYYLSYSRQTELLNTMHEQFFLFCAAQFYFY